jgi:hypothetical protein
MAELSGKTVIITGVSLEIGRKNRLLTDQTGQAPKKIAPVASHAARKRPSRLT